MYSMTDSKIIQQAQQDQQFQQHPTYFHRNINPNQISHDITFIENDVNIFINKLHNTQSKIKSTQSKLKLPQQTYFYNYKTKQYRYITKPKSQIDKISSNTQSLIQDLTWMNTVKNIQRKSISCNNNEYSIILDSHRQFNNENQGHKTRRLSHIESNKKNPIKNQNKTMPFTNSKSTQINKSRFIRQSKGKLPSTIDIFNRSSTVYTSVENQQLRNKNKIYFGNNKNLDLLEQFDDKDTVVNEPLFKGKRKYSKAKVKTEQIKQSKNQQSSKLSKKKLFQQILKLQHSIQELKNQKQRNQSSQIYRQNQALFFNKLNYQKPIQEEDYYQINQSKFERKSIQNIQQLKKHSIQALQRKNITLNKAQNQLLNKPQVVKTRFQIKPNENNKNKNKSCQNHKISLAKWVSQVWEDI